MNHLYIDHPGSQVGVRCNQLVIRKNNGCERLYPLRQIDRITVTTQVHFSGAAITALFRQGIVTFFCSQSGFLRGQFQPSSQSSSRFVSRRAAQYALLNDKNQCLRLARTLIVAKIRNQQRIIYEWKSAQSKVMMTYVRAAMNADSIDGLRGYEGQAAKVYFDVLGNKLSGTGFYFKCRNRPAQDPVNAVLSFTYALLQSEIALAIDYYGLDRYAGFFHVSDDRQPALVVDLMEPFRPLCDRLCVRLLTTQLTVDDFVLLDDGRCQLRDGSRGHLLTAWENLMNKRKQWRNERSYYRRIIKRHVEEWSRYLDGCLSIPDWWTLHDHGVSNH